MYQVHFDYMSITCRLHVDYMFFFNCRCWTPDDVIRAVRAVLCDVTYRGQTCRVFEQHLSGQLDCVVRSVYCYNSITGQTGDECVHHFSWHRQYAAHSIKG